MASPRETPAQAVFQHQESNTPTECSLTALDDTLLAYIISFLRWGHRRQLRAVCHRFKALVDKEVTKVEMDLTKFSEEKTCDLVKKAALLWPGTRSVQLKTGKYKSVGPAIVDALASCDWPNLEIMKVEGLSSATECVAAFTSSKGWPSLRELYLSKSWDGGGLSTRGIEAMSKGSNWAKLEVLMIGCKPLGLNGGALLARLSHKMPALRSLCLRQSKMSDENLKHFCEGSWPSLEILELTFNKLGPESGAIFAEASKRWVKLRELDVFGSKLANNGLEHLLQGHWPCLKKLGLGKSGLTVRAGRLLADASQRLPSLREFDLSMNDLEDSGFCALLEGHWPLIERLGIHIACGGMGTLSALAAASVRCPKIRELRIFKFSMGDIHVLARGTWDSVTKLEVSLYGFSSRLEDVGALASLAPCLPSLKELHLQRCDLNDSDLEVVLRGQWRGLEVLNLSGNKLTNASAVLLAEASLNVLSGIKRLDL